MILNPPNKKKKLIHIHAPDADHKKNIRVTAERGKMYKIILIITLERRRRWRGIPGRKSRIA